MKKSTGIIIGIALIVLGVLNMLYLESGNDGSMSKLFTIIITLPIGASWLLSGISAILFINGTKKASRVFGFILQSISTLIMILLTTFLTIGGDDMNERLYGLPALLTGIIVFFIPRMLKKKRGAANNA